MKFTPAQIERMALWAIVLILILVVVFAQRRSAFTPAAGRQISLVDLQEYAQLTELQKMNYRNTLSQATSALTLAASSNNYTQYSTKLASIMPSVFMVPTSNTMVTSNTMPMRM